MLICRSALKIRLLILLRKRGDELNRNGDLKAVLLNLIDLMRRLAFLLIKLTIEKKVLKKSLNNSKLMRVLLGVDVENTLMV